MAESVAVMPLITDIPISRILEHPVVRELSDTVDYLTGNFKLPYIEKDKVLMSPGVWNGYFYSKDEITKAFESTDWNDRYVTSLYYDHEDNKSSEWIGEVKNVKMDNKTGFLFGDLYYFDPNTAMKMALGKPKSGVSPKVEGTAEGKSMVDFIFKNFSHVVNPAVKTAYINNSEGSELTEIKGKPESAAKAAGVEEYKEVSKMGETKEPASDIKGAAPAAVGTEVKNEVDASGFMNELVALMKKYGMMGESKEPAVPKEEEQSKKPVEAAIPASMKQGESDLAAYKVKMQEMQSQIETLRKKLNEPEDKVIITNSSKPVDHDEAMLAYLVSRLG